MIATLFVIAVVGMLGCVGAPPPTQVRISDGTASRQLLPQHAAQAERGLRALLASCSTRGPDTAASAGVWRTAEAAPSIAVQYPKPTRVQTPDGEIEVDAILFSPRAGDYVRIRLGSELRAYAKWKPEIEGALVCDPALELRRHDRVREFCAVSGAPPW